MILVPTRELSEQVSAVLRGLLAYCDKDVVIVNVASGATTHLQRYETARLSCDYYSM